MEEETSLTEFNSNKATLFRIDRSIVMAGECFLNDDLGGWFKYATLLRNESRVKMNNPFTKKKDKSGIKTREELDRKYKALSDRMRMYLQYKESEQVKSELINSLQDFQDYVLDYMDSKGMLLRDKPEDDGL